MQTPENERRLMLGLKPQVMNNNHRKSDLSNDRYLRQQRIDRMWAILIFLVGAALLVLAFTPNH